MMKETHLGIRMPIKGLHKSNRRRNGLAPTKPDFPIKTLTRMNDNRIKVSL